MERKFGALRLTGTLLKILGGIAAVLTAISLLGVCGTSLMGGAMIDTLGSEFYGDYGWMGMFGGIAGGLILSGIVIINGFGLALMLYAMGEGIFLILAIEQNTRPQAVVMETTEAGTASENN